MSRAVLTKQVLLPVLRVESAQAALTAIEGVLRVPGWSALALVYHDPKTFPDIVTKVRKSYPRGEQLTLLVAGIDSVPEAIAARDYWRADGVLSSRGAQSALVSVCERGRMVSATSFQTAAEFGAIFDGAAKPSFQSYLACEGDEERLRVILESYPRIKPEVMVTGQLSVTETCMRRWLPFPEVKMLAMSSLIVPSDAVDGNVEVIVQRLTRADELRRSIRP